MKGIIDEMYSLAPVWAQNMGTSAYGYFWKKRRFGGVFEEELKGFMGREDFSLEKWRDYQTIKLRKLLVHAFETVPFYRMKYKKYGFTLTNFERFELEHLKRLPFLEKEELRNYGKTTLLSGKRDKNATFFSSSGTTGTPTSILFSKMFHQRWSAAFEARIRQWAGVNYKDTRGMIGGRRIIKEANATLPFYRYNYFEKQTYFSAYHISKANAANYLKGMMKNKVSYMTGYAMSNYFLASMLLDLGLEAPVLKAVITSSEKLTPEMRAVFAKVYGCKTYDSYSGIEACGLISETPAGELLVSPDVGIMEFLNEEGGDVNFGETGEIVSTGFLNYDQPLIRYKIGDCATLSKNQSTKSGIQMLKIDEIQGRVEDKITGIDGREMVRFHGLYINITSLIAAQIVQESLDEFVFNVVVDNKFSKKDEILITKRLKSQLGEVKTSFNHVSEIPKNRNGKFQAVISKVSKI